MTDELINQTLGQFQITRELGRGGMAVVYEAYQPALQRRVAIKVLPRHFAHDQAFIERFRQEAIAAARLRHPNIITIYDVGQANDLNFIVMELLEGQPLSRLIEQGPMPAARVSRIVAQVASALDYAHQQGFVHRDIKPSNIMVASNEHATLMDFGIAKALSGARLTQTGATVGTPEYMSPEQVTGEAIDGRTDVYALGIVAYEMLTGQVPFSGSTATVLYKQANELPPPLRAHVPNLEPAVESVILHALAKRRDERYATAGQFAHALAAAAAGRPLARPTPPTHKVAGAPPRQTSAGWLPWTLAGGAALAVLCVAIAIIALLGRQNDGGTPTAVLSTPRPTSPSQATLPLAPTRADQATPVQPTAPPGATPMYGWPRLAYAAGAKGAWQIMITDLTTGQTEPLPGQPANSGVPAWSRDHTRLAFRSQADGSWQIYVIDVSGSNRHKLTEVGGNYEPNWAPDGQQLVYVSDRDGNKELYITDIARSRDLRLTSNSALDDDPNWSPDGQWIIFERREGDCFNIYVIRPDGSDERALTRNAGAGCGWATTPAWSPDGNSIAYEQSSHGKNYHIWIMDADGSSPHALTSGACNDVRPAWSPDGRWIAFSSDRDGGDGVYIVPANGGQPKRVDAGEGFDPAW